LVSAINSVDGEDECMGCPREIFALTSLQRLNLSFHGLRRLPPLIQQLEMLEELIILNNPLLESLPGELALLPNLKGLFIIIKIASTIATSIVHSKLDYCNSLYYNLPNSQLSRLQHIQNSLAHAVVKAPKFSHITPTLKSLHWLKVNVRIEFSLSHTRLSLLLNLHISIT